MLSDKEITKANLIKIYEDLPKLAEQIPAIKAEFDMNEFGVFAGQKQKELNSKCKTYGCGLGNAARLFDIVETDFNNSDSTFNYMLFGKRILPGLYYNLYKLQNTLWDFLFDWKWADYQPTFDQFIERVKYTIDMDLEIGSWDYRRDSFTKV
jgi:hypothetical protein